jgi:excisionase family DNA binding protein
MAAVEKLEKGMLRVAEAAQVLGLRPSTIRAWLLRRQIGCVRLSARCVRIPRSEVDRIISDGTVPARGGR